MLKKLIKKPYYYIPACPSCNSLMTGYYAKESSIDPSFNEREGLKNGELIISVKEVPYENVFCLDCGFSWHHNLKTNFLSLAEIDEQKQLRKTAEFYNSIDFKKRSFLSKIL